MGRNADIAARRKYVNLVKSVKDSGGTVHIFSSLHVSGEREYYYSEPLMFRCNGIWLKSYIKDLNFLFNGLGPKKSNLFCKLLLH